MAQDNDDILAQAEAEVRAEATKEAKDKLKSQLRKVAAAQAILNNETRALEVLKPSILEG